MAAQLPRRPQPDSLYRQPGAQEGAPFLTARLSRLILLSYQTDPALLTPFLPSGTELDFHDGRTFVSLVGLQFSNPAIRGLPLPFYREYSQVNLRFYVRRKIPPNNLRRGVVFIRQIVPHRPIAWAARNLFHETVVSRSMDQIHRDTDGEATLTEYGWLSGRQRYSIRAVCPSHQVFPAPDSVEEFLLERYWGYTRTQDGGCLEYRFRHPPWQISKATEAEASPEVGDFYGPPFAGLFRGKPDSAFAANGSEVALYMGHPC